MLATVGATVIVENARGDLGSDARCQRMPRRRHRDTGVVERLVSVDGWSGREGCGDTKTASNKPQTHIP